MELRNTLGSWLAAAFTAGALCAQQPAATVPVSYTVDANTKVPLSLINSVSTKHSAVGDRVYLRHAKAGELCERFDAVHLIAGGRLVGIEPTYRGEGKTFL